MTEPLFQLPTNVMLLRRPGGGSFMTRAWDTTWVLIYSILVTLLMVSWASVPA
jgi:hypothetical protein